MTDHVDIGHAILLAAELPVEAEWVLLHHERYDGSGLPGGAGAAPRSRSDHGSSRSPTRTRP